MSCRRLGQSVFVAAVTLSGLCGCEALPGRTSDGAPPARAAGPKSNTVAKVADVPKSPVTQTAAKEPIEQSPTPRALPQVETGPSLLPAPTPVPSAVQISPDGPPSVANSLPAPTAVGRLLNLAPEDRPIERAVELAQRLAVVEAEKQALLVRVGQLEGAIAVRDRMLFDSSHEVEQATAEMTATRDDLRTLRKELTAVSARMRQIEKADIDSIKAILESLEKLLDPNASKVLAK